MITKNEARALATLAEMMVDIHIGFGLTDDDCAKVEFEVIERNKKVEKYVSIIVKAVRKPFAWPGDYVVIVPFSQLENQVDILKNFYKI
jgi:hypothetical protein